jgi:probable F420-dependent oxidoreductase
MAHPHPFRFAATIDGASSGPAWRGLARKVEHLGFSSLLLSDHLGIQFSPLVALASAAEVTNTLRLGTLVLDNDFRHPVLQAQELTTLDAISEGRVEWGLGAGWLPTDYETSGIAMDPPSVRVDRLIESVTVVRALFGTDPVDHDGHHYQVHRPAGRPAVVQQPHPPLMIGASQRRLLSFAGREAEIVSVGPSLTTRPMFGQPPRHTPTEAADLQLSWIRAAAGDRFDRLELNMVAFPAVVTDDRAGQAERLASTMGTPPDQVLASPHVLLGSVDEICEALEERRDRWGVSYWAVSAWTVDEIAPVVERLTGR